MKFCALVRIFFRFQPSLHWCPVFSGIFFSERNTGTSAGGQGRVVYFSREFSRSSREKETHEHTNRLQISPVILTKGKEKSKATVAFDLRALSVGGSLEGVFPNGSSYVLLKKLCRDFRLRPAAQRESVMRDLSKLWDTVNVKFLSTVRPSLRALGKIKNFEGVQTKTPTKTEQTTQETRFQRHTTLTHTYIPTNTRRKYFCNKMRKVARFKPPPKNVLDAIKCRIMMLQTYEKKTENFCLLKHHTHTDTCCKKKKIIKIV